MISFQHVRIDEAAIVDHGLLWGGVHEVVLYNPKHDRLLHQQGIEYVLADNNSVTTVQEVILMADVFPNENNSHSHEVMLYKCEVLCPIARNIISYINHHDCCQDTCACVCVCYCYVYLHKRHRVLTPGASISRLICTWPILYTVHL